MISFHHRSVTTDVFRMVMKMMSEVIPGERSCDISTELILASAQKPDCNKSTCSGAPPFLCHHFRLLLSNFIAYKQSPSSGLWKQSLSSIRIILCRVLLSSIFAVVNFRFLSLFTTLYLFRYSKPSILFAVLNSRCFLLFSAINSLRCSQYHQYFVFLSDTLLAQTQDLLFWTLFLASQWWV